MGSHATVYRLAEATEGKTNVEYPERTKITGKIQEWLNGYVVSAATPGDFLSLDKSTEIRKVCVLRNIWSECRVC